MLMVLDARDDAVILLHRGRLGSVYAADEIFEFGVDARDCVLQRLLNERIVEADQEYVD